MAASVPSVRQGEGEPASLRGEGMAKAAYRVVRATKDDRSFMEIAALDKVAWRDAGGNYRHDEDHSDGGEWLNQHRTCNARLPA